MSQIYQQTLSLEQIQIYSSCPRQYGYSIGAPKPQAPEDHFIKSSIRTLIKQSYANRSEHGYDPQWDTIKSRVNKLCFKDININDKEAFQFAYKRSYNILRVMHHWYYKLFCNDSVEGLVNVPLNVLVNKTTVNAEIDIALLDSKHKLIPIIFNYNDILPTMLYNNIQFKTLLWMIYKETGVYPKLVYYYVINNESIHKHEVYNKTPLNVIENYVNFIVRGIENKIFYPSVNTQCDTCSYNKICTI
jgi:hypothetical protein